jgi:uncharacterized protein (TIGR03067 family)
MEASLGDEKKKEEGTFTLDTSKDPRLITLTSSKDSKVIKGIYKFDGDDTLVLCASDGSDAPKEFKTSKGDMKVAIMTLKRKK